MQSAESRARMMGEEQIRKILIKLAAPGIVASLINAIYNIIDTMFVGMLNNTSAIGAVSIVFPLFILISAFGLAFGIGAGSYISRLLGENNKELANKTASTTFFTSLVCGIIFTISGLYYLDPLLRLFGATDTIMPYARDYSVILVSGSIVFIMNMVLNNMIRAEGNAKYSMFALCLGAILNIILDPIFMFGFNMGIKGAAVATVLAKFIAFVYLIWYFMSGKSYIRISPKYFTISKKIYVELMKIGVATFGRRSLSSLSMGLLNIAAKPYGDAAVAAMGISLHAISIGIFAIYGYNQGFQPIAAYNYGAKKYERLQEAIKLSLKWTTVFTTIVAILSMIFAREIILVFSKDIEVIEIGVKTLRAICLLFPLFGFQQVYATLFLALGKGREALILSLARNGLFLIPAILFLPRIFQLNGVILCQTVADFFTIIVTAYLAILMKKDLNMREINVENRVSVNG